MDLEFKVFSLNCWGIALVSKDRKARMLAISEYLASSQFDVVCLQEVWTDEDFNLIKSNVSNMLPYAHYFYSGVTGSGVCVFSRYPMDEVFFHQWPVNGYIHKLHHGDWFGGKGVGLCRLTINNFKVNVYSAHLHAEYNRDCDEYQAHRVVQAFDTAQFIQLTSGDADLVVLAGDLNTEPDDLAYRFLISVPGLVDACIKDESAHDKFGTNECFTNSYTPSYLVDKKSPGKRIDYIMYHPGSNVKVNLKKYWIPLPDRVPNCDFSYSDHEPIAAVLHVNRNENPISAMDYSLKKTVLEEGIDICNDALQNLRNHKMIYNLLSFMLLILLIMTFGTEAPFGMTVFYHIFKLLITACLFYAIIMGTLWNYMEKHGILTGKLAMEISLRQLKNENFKQS